MRRFIIDISDKDSVNTYSLTLNETVGMIKDFVRYARGNKSVDQKGNLVFKNHTGDLLLVRKDDFHQLVEQISERDWKEYKY